MSELSKIIAAIAVIVASHAISLYLFIYDLDQWPQQEGNKNEENRPSTMKVSRAGWIYMVIGIIADVLLVFCFRHYYSDNSWLFNAKRFALIGLIWPITYIDYKTYRIPNTYIIAGGIIRILFLLAELLHGEKELTTIIAGELLAALIVFIASLLCRSLIKNGVGWGDIKLMVIMALFLGVQGLPGAIMMALIISFLSVVVLMMMHKKGRKDVIPFGPFIVLGTYLSLFLTGV